MIRLIALFLVLALSTQVPAIDRSDLRLHVAFENSLKPHRQTGQVKLQFNKGKRADISFTAGRRGRAVLLKKGVSINYVGTELFANTEGTMAFWVRPVGWKGGMGKFHWYANLFSPTTSHLFYTYGSGGQAILYVTGRGRKPVTLGQNHTWDGFAPDKWTHLALTFKRGEQVFYIDGTPMQKHVDPAILIEPAFNGKVATINLHEGHPANAIDDLMAFGRALTEKEVRALFGAPEFKSVVTASPMSKPTVDGRQSSPGEWTNASSFVGWLDESLGLATSNQTQVHIGHQKQQLFIRFRRPIPEIYRKQPDLFVGSPVKIVAKTMDADLSGDDHVAVRLRSPQGNQYSFAINGSGIKRDARNGQVKWNGTWSAKQRWDSHFWIAEMAIPLDKLEASSNGWQVNFSDSHRQIQSADVVWHRGNYGRLLLSEQRVRLNVSNWGELSSGQAKVVSTTHAKNPLGVAHSIGVIKARLPDKTTHSPEKPQPIAKILKKNITASANRPAKRSFSSSITSPQYSELIVQIENADRPLYRWQAPFVYSPQQNVAAHYLPSYRRLRAIVDSGSKSALANVDRIVLSVTPMQSAQHGGKNPASDSKSRLRLQKTISNPKHVRQVVEFDCDKLPIGHYELKADFLSGKTSQAAKARFEILPDPEWLNNKLGLTPLVPKPWTAVRQAGHSISVLGRKYHLGEMGMPQQVDIGGRKLLAKPVNMSVVINGRRQQLKARVSLKRIDDSQVTFTATAKMDGVSIAVNGSVEFDGYVQNSIQIRADKAVTLDGLTVEFPLKREYAEVFSPQEYFPVETGLAPTKERVSKPNDGLRLGDAERGLQFHCNAAVQRLIPGGKVFRVRYEFIKKPIQLSVAESRKFTIHWQALPVKPRSKLYRKIHIDDAVWTTKKKQQPFHITPVYTEGWNRHWNYHNFWNREVFKKDFIEKLKKRVQQGWKRDRNAFCMYLNITTFDANTPEYRRYRFEWVGDAAEYTPPNPMTRDQKKQTMINSHSKTFLDFYMWHIDKTIRYLTDGGKIPIHCYLDNSVSNRPYMKRLYRIVKGINPHNQIIAHMSGDNSMHAYAFADWMVEGEENTASYINRLNADPSLPKNYTRILTLDTVRARYSPYAFGDKFYLYQFWGWKKSAPAREHLWSLLAAHDGTTWAAGGPGYFKKPLSEFGWDEKVRFVPYWRKNSGISVSSTVKGVVASGWTRGQKQLMVLVVNDKDKSAKASLSINPKRFGFESSTVSVSLYRTGGLNGKPKDPTRVRKHDAKTPLSLVIPPRSFQLIRFQP